ncbi:unnamed protein product, partial [Symbiodinium sp. KB8]
VIHGDASVRADALAVLYVERELGRFYSQTREALKSRQACFEFYLGMANGKGLDHILKIGGDLSFRELSKMGIMTEEMYSDCNLRKITSMDPQLVLQDHMMHRLFNLRFCVQKHRLHGLALFMFALPYKLVRLASGDSEEQELVRTDLVHLMKCRSRVESRAEPFWKKLSERTCLMWTLVRVILDRIQQDGGHVGADVRALIGNMFSHVGHSAVIEDAFQRMRRQETLTEAGSNVSSCRLWKVATDSKLLAETYNFREVAAADIPEERFESLPPNFFVPRQKDCSVPLRNVATLSSTLDWISFAPPFLQYSEDIALITHLHTVPELASCVWRSIFMPKNCIVKNKKLPDKEKCYLNFGTSTAGYCCILWPLQKQVPLLKHCALTCFDNINLTLLKKLCKDDLGFTAEAGISRVALAMQAIEKILKVSTDKAADIMQQSVAGSVPEPHHELLDCEVFVDCVHKDDLDDVRSHIDQKQKLQREVFDTCREAREIKIKKSKKPATKRAREPTSFKSREDWTAEQAVVFAPPETRFYKDHWNGRWIMFCGEGPISSRFCRSRSWGATGSDTICIRDLLRKAWERWTALTGEECWVNFDDF